MIDNDRIEELSKDLLKIYERVENDLLINVANALVAGDYVPGYPTTEDGYEMFLWQSRKLEQLGALKKKNMLLLQKLTGRTEKELALIFLNIGIQSLELDEKIYREALKRGLLFEPVPVAMSENMRQILNAAIKNAKIQLNLVNSTALESAQAAYTNAVNQVYLETELGISSYQEAEKKAVQTVADKGITGVTYISAMGKVTQTTVDVAVRRSILTSGGQMANKMQEARAKEWGSNLVRVTQHFPSRPEHATWQGKIFSLEGSTEKYPNLAQATGYGTVTGLGGINCKHRFFPWFEGISDDQQQSHMASKKQTALYDKTQEQRGLERAMRQQKRRELLAKSIDDEAGVSRANMKQGEISHKLRALTKQAGLPRRRDAERIITSNGVY